MSRPDVTDLRPGDRVACSGSQCAHHAELVAVPRSLTTRVPDNVELDAAAFITLGTIAMESIRLTRATFGSTVVMYGLGLLGLLGDPDRRGRRASTRSAWTSTRVGAPTGCRFGAIATPDPTDEAAVTGWSWRRPVGSGRTASCWESSRRPTGR